MVNKAINFKAKHYKYQYQNESKYKTNQHKHFSNEVKIYLNKYLISKITTGTANSKDIYYKRFSVIDYFTYKTFIT